MFVRLGAVEPRIRLLLQEFPDMPSTVIMEWVGWTRGKTVIFERFAALRPLYRPVDPVSRTQYEPGELAQCDLWFPPAEVPLGLGQVGHPPGAGDGGRLFAGDECGDDPDPGVSGSVGRTLAAAAWLRSGAAGFGVGQRIRGRAVGEGRT